MTLTQAITMLKKEYERGLKMDYVRDPLAWALHKVWREADRRGQK